MKVGFIGVGVMGGPMASNVLKGGHDLTVFDLDGDAVRRLVEAGATGASSAREVGAASEVVVTMLPEPRHVREALLGPDGAARGMRPGGVVIDMSTIDPVSSRAIADELAALGIEMVDSPVGKTSEHAATGTLTLMVGGKPEVIERVKPVLDCMGNETYLCGGVGAGHAMKTVNNLLATTIMAANTEALAIGVKCGLTLELMMEVMKTTMANNAQLYVAMPKKAFKGDDSPGFMVKLACKDVRQAVELARSQGFEPHVGAACQRTLEEAMEKGFASRDTAALMRIREDQLGIKVRPADPQLMRVA
ncbi:NAD(P)-dependent oxidoreductase [Roseomonas sp. OT10]|uniref:NAD(P)-dependent oxidoreductase n=1 Tax=Roseomonas cutis TaxID=2897332 RepID=UPI001E65DC88|nr:NAD(P)-dependent oxidoreductase [Roseomonas sp. OT10]UFN48453.1 NAD(P)-dependent oxidoreductase [Roseomonas sp. OT10]